MGNPIDKDGLLLKRLCEENELCEENDVSVNRVQTQYIRVRQVESCHRISEEATVAIYLNNKNDSRSSKTGLGLTTA